MSGAFPTLGFDPARGDPEQVRRCAREHARAATELDSLANAVSSAGARSASWEGVAATAFTASLMPLTAHLRTAADSFGTIAAQLTAWAAELEELQAQARMLERSAEQAFDRLRAAHASAAVPGAVLIDGSLLTVDDSGAQEELRRLTVRAQDVRATWSAACRRLASAVQAAADAAPPLPNTVRELVWDHRVAIARTAQTASFFSLPAVAIPVVGPVASGALSAVALAGDSALAVYADGSSADVALGVAGIGLGGAARLTARVAGPAGTAAWKAVERGLRYGDIGTWVVGTSRTVFGAPAPAPQQPVRSSAPALRQLLVEPVTGRPSRKRR